MRNSIWASTSLDDLGEYVRAAIINQGARFWISTLLTKLLRNVSCGTSHIHEAILEERSGVTTDTFTGIPYLCQGPGAARQRSTLRWLLLFCWFWKGSTSLLASQEWYISRYHNTPENGCGRWSRTTVAGLWDPWSTVNLFRKKRVGRGDRSRTCNLVFIRH